MALPGNLGTLIRIKIEIKCTKMKLDVKICEERATTCFVFKCFWPLSIALLSNLLTIHIVRPHDTWINHKSDEKIQQCNQIVRLLSSKYTTKIILFYQIISRKARLNNNTSEFYKLGSIYTVLVQIKARWQVHFPAF